MGIFLTELLSTTLWAANKVLPGSGPGHSAGAGSPFTTYDAGIVIYTLLVGFLVSGLLIGAFIVLNYGMMSKRPNDRIGKRTPSEPGFFKNQMWPREPYYKRELPAEEDDFEKEYQKETYKDDHIDHPSKAA